MSESYFSHANAKFLERCIRYGVLMQTGHVLQPQSMKYVHLIMQSIYFENRFTTPHSQLNQLVIQTVVPRVTSAVLQDIAYQKSLEAPFEPLSYGVSARS